MVYIRERFLTAWTCIFLLLAAGGLFIVEPVYGADRVTIYLFWSTGCPHCKDEKAFFEKLVVRYPQIDIKSLEVKNNPENAKLFSGMADAYGVRLKGVPATFIGGLDPIVGYQGDETTGREIESRIRQCIEQGCADPLERMNRPGGQLPLSPQEFTGLTRDEQGVCTQDAECPKEEAGKDVVPPAGGKGGAREKIVPPKVQRLTPAQSSGEKDPVITLPLLGELDTSRAALPYQTLVIAGLDAFNPCAFFVLFTLLGILLHVQSRRRLLLIGGIFVFFSGFIYFVFMAVWLNIFLLTGRIAAVTMAAGAVALIIAVINIKDFFFFKKGVSLSIPEKAKPRLFDRMRRLVKATSLPSAIAGTVVLAVAANTYELFCTAGFPMVYTRILTLHNLSKIEYYLYLVLYNVIYVIPLALIVMLFAVTLGAKKLTERQGQVLKLVSGMMMLCLGVVLLVNPELLNNIFVTVGLLAISLAVSGIIILTTRRAAVHET